MFTAILSLVTVLGAAVYGLAKLGVEQAAQQD